VDGGTLSGDAGIQLGVAYDLVLDVQPERHARRGRRDRRLQRQPEACFYVCRDKPPAPGPFVPVELTYDLSIAAFDAQNTFYPANIASLGQLPLVVVSHGNGHNYQWYDHLGTHLASYGYVLMSHENNTGPGLEFAATTTLSNTDAS
jgi:predicted dienelactone hydrolase